VAGDAVALCHHAVSDGWRSSLAARPEDLEELVGHDGRARRRLAITFDDAFAPVYPAAPLLDLVGAPATVFVPTTYVAHAKSLAWTVVSNDRWCDTPWEEELRPMSDVVGTGK
jgi:peptidoglycan/xylan/chitin deacetylase (PgdA/CDA1 family)